MIEWDVAEVIALPDFRLRVRFADATAGEVDLRALILGPAAGVFEALRDPAIFATVGIEDGALRWPNGLDIAPDAMYDDIRAAQQDGA